MFGVKKPKVLIWSAIFSLLVFSSCEENIESMQVGQVISGQTQGTTYSIIVSSNEQPLIKSEIDSLLHEFDLSLSTYIDGSVISKINASQDEFSIVDDSYFFKNCYKISQHIYEKTNGDFDPSVFPLVKGWGFMNNLESPLEAESVDSLLEFISFKSDMHHSIQFNENEVRIKKIHPNFKIDFNAVAQGQSVDVVSDYLMNKGFDDFYVEIGGELRTSGFNREGDPWKIGIDSPQDSLQKRVLNNVLNLTNNAVATSGNYRKFYEVDGVKYSHTLNPKSGYPVRHSLLSATVIARTCAEADAYATAFMVMGLEKSLEFVIKNPSEELEVYLLYAEPNGEISRAMSEGFESYCSY